MGNWGMKVSRAGYDVSSCSDNQLLFSSSFPLPVIGTSGTAATSGSQTVVTHGLGYIPVFIDSLREDTYASEITSSNTYIGTGDLVFGGTGDCDHSYYIMQRDIETEYEADNIGTVDQEQGTYNADWGFKVSKDGYDVGTAGVANLVSFSGASDAGYPIRHQIIHKTGTTSVSNGGSTTVAHGLGYKPMFFVWRKVGSRYSPQTVDYTVDAGPPVTVNIDRRVWCDDTNIIVENDSGDDFDFAYLIFKDPLI